MPPGTLKIGNETVKGVNAEAAKEVEDLHFEKRQVSA